MVFKDQWKEFIGNIHRLIETKSDYGNMNSREIIKTIEEIREGLVQQDALTRVEFEVSELNRMTKNHLERELEQWNDTATSVLQQSPPESDMNSLLKDAQTVKDSIEQHLSLPNWMNRLLSVLNELLDLIT